MLLNPYRFGGALIPWSLAFNFVDGTYVPHAGGCAFNFVQEGSPMAQIGARALNGTISGTVAQQGTPVQRRVRCYKRSDGLLAGDTMSVGGAYTFSNLDTAETYYVVALDDTGTAPNFNALVCDQVTTTAPAGPDLDDDLNAIWKLDEASGDALDAVGTKHLTDTNTVGSGAGKLGPARDFDAVSGEHFVGSGADTGQIDFTFACWARADSLVGSDRTILGKWIDGGSCEYLLYLSVLDSRFHWQVRAGANTVNVAASTVVQMSTWYHIVCWHDAAAKQIGISVNNGAATTAAQPSTMSVAPVAFRIGAHE